MVKVVKRMACGKKYYFIFFLWLRLNVVNAYKLTKQRIIAGFKNEMEYFAIIYFLDFFMWLTSGSLKGFRKIYFWWTKY